MSNMQAELAMKVEKALEKMFFNREISFIRTDYLADGSAHITESGRSHEPVGAFLWLNVVLMSEPSVLEEFSKVAFMFTHTYDQSFNIMIEGQRVERSTFRYQGEAKDMKPLLEYLWWWNESEPISGMPKVSGLWGGLPSYLPSLIMSKNRISRLTKVDKKILEYYGIDSVNLARLAEIQKARIALDLWDKSFWLDFVSANELWFENPCHQFIDIITEHMLNDKTKGGE